MYFLKQNFHDFTQLIIISFYIKFQIYLLLGMLITLGYASSQGVIQIFPQN
jgi:hypothetical protein